MPGDETRQPLEVPKPSGSRAARILRKVGLERPVRRHVLPRIRSLTEESRGVSEERRLHNEVKSAARGALLEKGPVLVGPWLSEVGFEVLYWVPFLRWLGESVRLDPSRLIAVSRGGTHSWYSQVCGSYRDIFDHMSVDEFRQLTEARWHDVGGQKQMEFTKWDHAVFTRVAEDLDWNRHSVLHPALMYRMFRSFWRGKAGMRHVLNHTRFGNFEHPNPGPWAHRLPKEDFVAVKFYFRPSFPDTLENRRRVTETVRTLAERWPVVLLNTGLTVDEHVDVDPGTEERVTWFLRDVPPDQNLHVQSIAISRSQGFVGTYGGLSYLAPAFGVPSLAFYSQPEHFLPSHLEVAQRAAASTGVSLTVIGPEQFELASSVGLLGVPKATTSTA